MKLITISGLDGSGKSTQLDLLEKKLNKKFKTQRLHMVKFSIANKIFKQKRTGFEKTKAKTESGFWGVFSRKIAIIIDIIRFRIFYRIKTFENKIDFLLIDRYFYDQIINIKYLDKKKKINKQSVWMSIAENYLVQPDLKVYLEIDPKKIMRRSRNIEQGIDYLDKKNKLYKKFSKKWKMLTINGNEEKEKIKSKISKLI